MGAALAPRASEKPSEPGRGEMERRRMGEEEEEEGGGEGKCGGSETKRGAGEGRGGRRRRRRGGRKNGEEDEDEQEGAAGEGITWPPHCSCEGRFSSSSSSSSWGSLPGTPPAALMLGQTVRLFTPLDMSLPVWGTGAIPSAQRAHPCARQPPAPSWVPSEHRPGGSGLAGVSGASSDLIPAGSGEAAVTALLAGIPLLHPGIWPWGFLLGLGQFLFLQALGVSASPVLTSPELFSTGGIHTPPPPAPGARPCSPRPVPVGTTQG